MAWRPNQALTEISEIPSRLEGGSSALGTHLLLSVQLLCSTKQKMTASEGFLQNPFLFACGQNLMSQTGENRHFNICP